VRIRSEDEVEAMEAQQRSQAEAQARSMQFQHADAAPMNFGEGGGDDVPDAPALAQMPMQRDEPKIGRNDPCPCGSGKKYKQCHGKLA